MSSRYFYKTNVEFHETNIDFRKVPMVGILQIELLYDHGLTFL
jgi:hypothetical protein